MDRAILTGVVKYLRENLSIWNATNCMAMADGRPNPMMGKEFCSVHVSEMQGTTDDQGLLREVWGFGVTVTKRIEAVPYDKIPQSIYLEETRGISKLINQILYAINNRWEVARCIEAELPTAETCPEIFKFINCIRVMNPPLLSNRNPKFRYRDEEWMHGSHTKPTRNGLDGHVGISFTLNFGRLNIQIQQTEGNCQ